MLLGYVFNVIEAFIIFTLLKFDFVVIFVVWDLNKEGRMQVYGFIGLAYVLGMLLIYDL